MGTALQIQKTGDGQEMTVACSENFLNGVKIGDSIAVNGACQTVTRLGSKDFSFFSSKQTLELTNLGQIALRQPVNLEKALMMGSRLDGHLVSGHIDGVGQVAKVEKQQAGYLFSFTLPQNLLPLVIEKGSIAVEGISLTIYALEGHQVTVSVIPHTFEHTTLKLRKKGEAVNLETDVLGKYVARILSFSKGSAFKPPQGLEQALKDNGFWG